MKSPLFLLEHFRLAYFAGRITSPEHIQCQIFAEWYRGEILEGRLRAVVLHIANEFSGERKAAFGALLRAMGKFSGAPDYLLLYAGGCMGIEFKKPGGSEKDLSPMQKIVRQWFEWAAIPYHVVFTAEEAKALVRGCAAHKP